LANAALTLLGVYTFAFRIGLQKLDVGDGRRPGGSFALF
jgi:hypothetical protein